MPAVRCASCGVEDRSGGNFCSSCGAPLAEGGTWATPPISEEELAPEPKAPAKAAGPSLLVTRGPAVGDCYDLGLGVTRAGRAVDSEIFLDDVTVSRRHAEFVVDAEGISVRDVGSLNGTYVNADRIERRVLRDGDQVQIGKFRFQFLAGR